MAFWLSAFLILLPQESLKELDSPDPAVSLPRPAWLKETLSISLRDATFLEAVDAIARAVPGWTEFDDGILRLRGGVIFGGDPECHSRHIKVIASYFTETRGLTSPGGSRARASIYFTVVNDGRCRFVGSRSIRLTEIVEDSGKQILTGEEDKYPGSFGPGTEYRQYGIHTEM